MFDLAKYMQYLPMIEELIKLVKLALESNQKTQESNVAVMKSNQALADKIDAAQIDRNFVEREYGSK